MSMMIGLLLDAATLFLGTAWLLSTVAAVAPLPPAPDARVREASRLALLPAVGGMLVVATAFWPSLLTSLRGVPDHCGLAPAGDPHLCWLHASAGPLAWHDALAAGLLGLAMIGLAWRLGTWASAVWRLSRLDLVADAGRGAEVEAAVREAGVEVRFDLWVVPSDKPWCFVAGFLRPRLVVATAVVDALGPQALAAALAHETAHARRSDHLRRLAVDLASAVHAPGLGRRARRRWAEAAERVCDEEAAVMLNSRLVVAEALVRFQRLVNGQAASPTTALSFGGHGGLERRVHALLAEAPRARRDAWRAWPWVAAAALVASADAVHHLLEQVLGFFHG